MDVAGGSRDPRVAQANERTLLAWVRTSIGLMAFGFILARSGPWLSTLMAAPPPEPSTRAIAWIGVGLVVLGAVSAAASSVEYVRVRRAIIHGRPMMTGAFLPTIFTAIVAVAGLGLAALLALGIF